MNQSNTPSGNDLHKEATKNAFEALSRELKKEPLFPERLTAISATIRTLSEIKPLPLCMDRKRAEFDNKQAEVSEEIRQGKQRMEEARKHRKLIDRSPQR